MKFQKFPRTFFLPLFAVFFSTFIHSSAVSEDRSLLVDESFANEELGPKWRVQTGAWTLREGALHGAEIPADKHSAAARYIVETQDAVYKMKFRFTGEGRAMHFGFDPVRGALDKRGHLFSVIISPSSWSILKHVDKDRPKEDPNEKLAAAPFEFKTGDWYSLVVTTKGTKVTASIETVGTLEAEHPTFSVKKPTLVFRALGDGIEIDDIQVSE